MKKLILVLSFVFSITYSFSNSLQAGEAYISKLYFVENSKPIDFGLGTSPIVIEHNTFYDEYNTVWIQCGEIPGFGIQDSINIKDFCVDHRE